MTPRRPTATLTLYIASILLLSCSNNTDAGSAGASIDQDTGNDTEFLVEASISPVISTVGIVTWSMADKQPLTSATIDFGPDTSYGFSAPVDLEEPNYRTLLLGMKPSSTIHFRISATSDSATLKSSDFTVRTDAQPSGLPFKTVTTNNKNALALGLMSTCSFNGHYAFILDEDGDYVWWYDPSGNIDDWVRARMTVNGKYMLIANGNVPGPNNGTLVKVSMDGLEETVYPLSARHHDVTVLPFGNIIAYFEYENTGTGTCDRLMEMVPDGSPREVFKIRDYFSNRATSGEWCHSNAVNYVPSEDAYYLSVLNFNSILKIDRTTGELIWVFGGEDSDFPDVSWNGQHQNQILDSSILLFNNHADGYSGFNSPSRALEFSVDETRFTAEQTWSYSSGKLSSFSMGDAKRLPNGNTLVVFSTAGTIHEINESGDLLREIAWGMGGAVGYVEWRESLYGPPQEYLSRK